MRREVIRGSEQSHSLQSIITPALPPPSLLWTYQAEAFCRVLRAYAEQFPAVLQYRRLSFVHSASTMVQYHLSSNRAYTSSSLLSQICFKVSWLASCQNISSLGNMVTNTFCPSGNIMLSNVSIFPSFTIPKAVLQHE